MKKIVFILLVLTLLSSAIVAMAANVDYHTIGDWSAAFCSEWNRGTGFRYWLNVYQYHGSDADITVPASLTWKGIEYPTVTVGQLFQNNRTGMQAVEHVTIPEGVTTLTEDLFSECTNLKSVKLPSTLEKIEKRVFHNCYALESIDIPSSVKEIGEATFYGCYALKKLVIPDGIEVIGRYFAAACFALEEVYLPDSVTVIEQSAFSSCKALKTIHMPASLISIGGEAFHECEMLNNVVLSGQLKKLDFSVFLDCASLTAINLPAGLESIGMQCFSGTSIHEIYIPASVTEFTAMHWEDYHNPFGRCPALTHINVDAANPSFKSVDGVLFSKDGTILIDYPYGRSEEKYVIPDGVTKLMEKAVAVGHDMVLDVPDSLQDFNNNINAWSYTLIVGQDSYALDYAQRHRIPYIIRGQNPIPGSGDVNGDGIADLNDIITTLAFIRMPDMDVGIDKNNADVNGDGSITYADVFMMLEALCQ